uniref:Serpin domain-containing protein n=1 Tax=Oreochromis niloticus TaxID=8128 RepID=A0A669B1I8_ORENI
MASATSLPKANSAFSLALLKQLSNNKTGNIFFSLFSISSALAMVMLGARGNTATQMSEVKYTCSHTNIKIILLKPGCFSPTMSKDCWGDVHSSFAKLLTELNRPEALFTFTVANRLYREKSCPFTQGEGSSRSTYKQVK